MLRSCPMMCTIPGQLMSVSAEIANVTRRASNFQGFWLFIVTVPVALSWFAVNTPPMANFACPEQLEKSIVTVVETELLGARFPTEIGIGVVIFGVHAVPEFWLSARLLICAVLAAPGPVFTIDNIHCRAFIGPVLFARDALSLVVPSVKLAVTLSGALIVIVVDALVEFATAPVQFWNM